MSPKMLYFDHMASTPLDPEVQEVLLYFLQPSYQANPSTAHPAALKALEVIEHAQKRTLHALNAPSGAKCLWTSGATEANNMILLGLTAQYGAQRKHIISTNIEHSATSKTLDFLKTQGFHITTVACQSDGLIDPDTLYAAITPQTLMISMHHVQNELGAVQAVKEIAHKCQSLGVICHLDCAQSIGKTPLNLSEIPCDFASLSAHKCYGPKGIGALYLRNQPKRLLKPLMHGGTHQGALRPGTPNIALIAAMAHAIVKHTKSQPSDTQHIKHTYQSLIPYLPKGTRLNGPKTQRVWHNMNVTLPPTICLKRIQSLKQTFNISSFSACNAMSTSPILSAIGIPSTDHLRTLRIGFGKNHTPEAIQPLQKALQDLVIP